MSLNVEALKRKVRKAIERFSSTLLIYRDDKDEYGEPLEAELVGEITSQYYKGRNLSISIGLEDKGSFKRNQQEKLMVIIDEVSSNLKEGDYFSLNGIGYKISDITNVLGVYYDCYLERR